MLNPVLTGFRLFEWAIPKNLCSDYTIVTERSDGGVSEWK
jgi:hypothetical protein